jgi:hypothetical protein
MPRGRGGARDGKIGKAYQNRTDLQGQNVVAAQPQNQPGQKMKAQAASGQAYGAAKAQLDSQKALSIQNTGQPTPPPTQGQPAPKRAPLTALNAPGDPNQSLFNGMDNIPGGGGSEALIPQMDQQLSMTALGLLDSLGDNVSPQVTMIKNYLRAQANNGIMQ